MDELTSEVNRQSLKFQSLKSVIARSVSDEAIQGNSEMFYFFKRLRRCWIATATVSPRNDVRFVIASVAKQNQRSDPSEAKGGLDELTSEVNRQSLNNTRLNLQIYLWDALNLAIATTCFASLAMTNLALYDDKFCLKLTYSIKFSSKFYNQNSPKIRLITRISQKILHICM